MDYEHNIFLLMRFILLLAGAVEYTNCIYAKG